MNTRRDCAQPGYRAPEGCFKRVRRSDRVTENPGGCGSGPEASKPKPARSWSGSGRSLVDAADLRVQFAANRFVDPTELVAERDQHEDQRDGHERHDRGVL